MTEGGKVHVIDDDDAVRESLEFLLASADLSVSTYSSAVEFLAAGVRDGSGCIVTDVRMPDMSGLDLLRRLKTDGILMPVIVMTGHGDVPLAVEAMKAGAFDFIEKPFDDDRLITVARAAIKSGSLIDDRQREQAQYRALIDTLSPREHDVLIGLVAGKPNKIIAYDLGISPRTVEVYRANLMEKMEAGSLSDLVRFYLISGASGG